MPTPGKVATAGVLAVAAVAIGWAEVAEHHLEQHLAVVHLVGLVVSVEEQLAGLAFAGQHRAERRRAVLERASIEERQVQRTSAEVWCRASVGEEQPIVLEHPVEHPVEHPAEQALAVWLPSVKLAEQCRRWEHKWRTAC